MASIYYPTSASVYTRLVGNSNLTEMVIGVYPDTIIYLTGSIPISASAVNSASYAVSSSFSATALTASLLTTPFVTDILLTQVFA